MRALPLLLLALVIAGAAPGPAQAAPETGGEQAAAPAAASRAQAPASADAPDPEDPYRKRMTAGHRVQPPRQRLTLAPQAVGRWKAATALAGAVVLLWGALASPERETRRLRRLRAGALLALGAAAGFGGWNFGALHYPEFGHAADSYRRIVGSKYFAELGYERLYACAAVADVEAGLRAQVERRYPRTLAADDSGAAAAALAQPDTCKSHFAPERWASFQQDVGWFRDRVSVRQWQEIQAEPGFSATPAWTLLAGGLANLVPVTDAGIRALRWLDPLLLAGMWGAVALVFGWRAACVGLLFWGTNYAAGFDGTGGSYLRQGWLVASVLALCALRREHPAAAGALLGVAIAFEVFPIFVLAAFTVQALAGMGGTRRLAVTPEQRRLFAGAFVAGGLLFAVSLAAGGGLEAWSAWLANRQAWLATPLADAMGLAAVVSRGWVLAALLLGYLAPLARVSARAHAWEVGVLGLGLVLMAGAVPAYASAGLLAFGLLWPRGPAIGIALCLLSVSGWWIAGSGPPSAAGFAGISLASAFFVAVATAFWPAPRTSA